jgi:soluble lytic murein transglycosylase-like protein
MGVVGLFIALGDVNTNYVKNQQALFMMSSELMKVEGRMGDDNWKLRNYDLLEFKVNAFDLKYPKFSRIVDSVYRKSHEYGFHPDLVLGMMKVESNYDPNAVSYCGAYGLMQVNLSVWKNELAINEDSIFDVDYNIDLGLQILKRYLIESKGNMPRALHLYNNGYRYNNTAYIGRVSDSLFNLSTNRDDSTPPLAN